MTDKKTIEELEILDNVIVDFGIRQELATVKAINKTEILFTDLKKDYILTKQFLLDSKITVTKLFEEN